LHTIQSLFASISINDCLLLTTLGISILLYLYQRYRASRQQIQKKLLLDLSSEIIDHPVIIFTERYRVLCANRQMQEYIKVKKGESLQQRSSLPFVAIEDRWLTLRQLLAMYESSPDPLLCLTEVKIKTQRGERRVNLRIVRAIHKGTLRYSGIAIFDIRNRLELSRIHYQNTTTGLPNHNKAIADIGLMASKMIEKGRKFAVAIISIDHFMDIISTIGYSRSLSLVSEIARYLTEVSAQQKLSLYHMTSNNFLLLIPDIKTPEESRKLVERYKEACEELLHDKSSALHYTISSGISLYPDTPIEELINQAYRALSQANKQGPGYTVVAQPESLKAQENDPIAYREIKQALDAEQFILYYQPIFDIRTNAIVSAEALIRWRHPDRGILTPAHFLPLVEKTGFMKALSSYVAREAINQLSIWNRFGFNRIQLAINLSMREFESADYPTLLEHLLHTYQVDASQIKIEITENIAMTDAAYSIRQFQKLKALGIALSLDDFGTGYSSFSMLESFPIDTLKIDQRFITDLISNKAHQSIVEAMIKMSHALGIKMIAEGIENDQTVERLRQLDCDYIQGYHIGKPMPLFEFQKLLRNDRQILTTDDIIIPKDHTN